MINNFTEIVTLRFTKEQIKDIDKIIKRKKDLYPSRSLFVRAAALMFIRELQSKKDKRRMEKRLLQNIKYE